MTDWTPTRLAHTDEETDHERASDRFSRYGAYLSHHPGDFHDDGKPLGAEDFAAAAWRVATSPIMSPPYVHTRPDLERVRFVRDDWDGTLCAVLDIPMPRSTLARDIQDRLPYLPDWQPTSRHSDGDYHGWAEPDRITPRGMLLTTTTLALPCTGWELTTPTETSGDVLTYQAAAAVRLLAHQLNEQAGPYVAALRGEGSAR